MEAFIPLALTLLLMWVLLIRPQQQRIRRQQALVASLREGDEVITAGGILGQIRTLEEELVVLEISPGVTMRVVRAAISRRTTEDDGSEDDGSEDDGGEGGER